MGTKILAITPLWGVNFGWSPEGPLPNHGYPNPGANTLRWGHTAKATTGLYGTMARTPFVPQWFRQPSAWQSVPYLRLCIQHAPHTSASLGYGGWLLPPLATYSHLGTWSHRVL